MKRDRTLSLWAGEPVGQLPRGQGSLTFGEAEARVLASIAATEKPAPIPAHDWAESCRVCHGTGVIGYSDPADWEPCDSCPMGCVRKVERVIGGTVTFDARLGGLECLRQARFARIWAGTLMTRRAGLREARNWLAASAAFGRGEFGRVGVLP